VRRSGDDGVWQDFYLCLLWRRIHTTATSLRDIYSVAVPEINLSKLEHAAQRLTRCVSEIRPSQLMKMMISASITFHNLIFVSVEALAKRLGSVGENATLNTL